MTDPHASDQLLIFIDLLQKELERSVIPDPGAEVARNTVTLAAKQLRRLLVEKIDVPEFRREAIRSYQSLLPGLRSVLSGDQCEQLDRTLRAGDTDDWAAMDVLLCEAMTALLARNDTDANRLAGQLTAIDAQLRDRKEQALVERSKPRVSRKTAAAAADSADEEQVRLHRFLMREFPRETALKIVGIKQIPGGFSKHTLFIHLENTIELPDCLVMRRDGPFAGSSVVAEYPVIQTLHAAGVAVPRPYAIDAIGEVYGKPFILFARAEGSVIGDFVAVKTPSREVALDLAKKLARLHTAPFGDIESHLAGGTISVTERMAGEIEICEATWKSVIHEKSYVVQAALDWLKRNIDLAEGRRAVVHRDIGVHNMLISNHEVTAILDWETVAVGNPAEDVGCAYYTAVQMIEWPEFLAAYEAAAGFTVDRRQLDFYMLWSAVRILPTICKNVDPVFRGGRGSLADYYLGDQVVQILIQRIASKLTEMLVQ